ncbi:MAG: hypothetical protein JZU50_12950 [Desulfobulbaceae bacterium]|nr:hypothetical protein [Desulfobulbaceae bacterium]
MHDWDGYPKYVSVAEKKAKAEKKLKQLQKKRPGIKPVVLVGTALARTWWGKSWNRNLERYADYSNRIGRGRSYVRHGAVLDLQIAAGEVLALVQGSSSKPYEVKISIAAIGASQWQAIKKQCDGQLKSMQDLLAGKFPKELNEIFLAEGKGLFPSPKEIKFDCSCPDWASMCKHVAAALYGIGARLDEDPSLFFTLRNVRTEDLVVEAIQEKTAELLAKAKRKSAKAFDEADLSSLFGIELDTPPDFDRQDRKTGVKLPAAIAGKLATQPPATGPAKDTPKKNPARNSATPKLGPPAQKTPIKRNRPPLSPIDQVAALVAKHKAGVDADTLAQITGIAKTKIYALVHRLKLQGIITNKSHGVYVKK